MIVRRAAWVLATLGCVLACARASASPATLKYAAPADCPARSDFVAAVEARGGQIASGAGGESELAVVIRRDGDTFRGSVQLAGRSGGESIAREVHSERCGEVVEGLAVVAAIASRPDADAEPAEVAKPGEPASAEPVAAKAGSVPAPRAVPPRRLVTRGQFGDESVAVEAGQLGIRSDQALTLWGGVELGLVPGLALPRFDLTVGRANYVTTPGGAGYLVGGLLRVRWSVFGPARYEAPGYSSQLYGLTASVGGCSPFTYDLEGFIVVGCGQISAGYFAIDTEELANGRRVEEEVGTGSAGFDLEARYNFGSLFHASAALGGDLWLAQFGPKRADGSDLFRTSRVSGHVTLGFGVHF